MKKLVVTLAMMGVLAVSLFLYDRSLNTSLEGTVTIVLSDNGSTLSENEHAFTEDDSLFTLLDEHYTILCADRNYRPDASCEPRMTGSIEGRILLEIEALKSDWFNTFIEISINDVPASYGIDQLPFDDGDIIELNLKPVS